MEHKKAFITYRRAACTCGHIIEGVSRKNVTQRLIAHLLHPAAANKIADSREEHNRCTIEEWNERWGVCQGHNVYIDLHQDKADETLEMSFG